MSTIQRIRSMIGKIKYKLFPYNMHASIGERYYAAVYLEQFLPYLRQEHQSILDIGCNYGRITIPLLKTGRTVLSTDLVPEYERYIRSKINVQENFSFRVQPILDTIQNRNNETFDVIICTELIHMFQHQGLILRSLWEMLNPDGIILTSHRTKGHYLYKSLIKGQHAMMKPIILEGRAGAFWCQTDTELIAMYEQQGFKNIALKGLGIFSGISPYDPWGHWMDPKRLVGYDKSELREMEDHPMVQQNFMNNARYIIVTAQKPSLPIVAREVETN
jgi:2-polyprenyl-3-methyl-5-hydroxy-6-metoxy-1,4-benzoquinol methylase